MIQRLVHFRPEYYRIAAARRRDEEVVSDQAFTARQAMKAIAYPTVVSVDIVRNMSQAQQATYFNEHPDEQRNFEIHRLEEIAHRDAVIDHRDEELDHREAVIDHRFDANHSPEVDHRFDINHPYDVDHRFDVNHPYKVEHRNAEAEHRETVVDHREAMHVNQPPPPPAPAPVQASHSSHSSGRR